MKIILPKTLAEPWTIPWENINQALESTEVAKLLDELLNNVGYSEEDLEDLLQRIDTKILENDKRLEDLHRRRK